MSTTAAPSRPGRRDRRGIAGPFTFRGLLESYQRVALMEHHVLPGIGEARRVGRDRRPLTGAPAH